MTQVPPPADDAGRGGRRSRARLMRRFCFFGNAAGGSVRTLSATQELTPTRVTAIEQYGQDYRVRARVPWGLKGIVSPAQKKCPAEGPTLAGLK